MPDYESFNQDDEGKKDEAYDAPVPMYDLDFVAPSGLKGFIYKINEAAADKWTKSINKAYPGAEINRKDHDEDRFSDRKQELLGSGE